jgi:hypothetical protein
VLYRDEAGVMDKLHNLADKFNELYDKREYTRAMFAYHTASSVAVFLEMDREEMNFLFGTANTEETDEKGLFDRDRVHRAQWECIMLDRPMPYVDSHDMADILKCAVGGNKRQ